MLALRPADFVGAVRFATTLRKSCHDRDRTSTDAIRSRHVRKWTACVSEFQNNHSAHLPAPQHKLLQRETKATPCLGASHDMPVLRPQTSWGLSVSLRPCARVATTETAHQQMLLGVAMRESGLRACPNSKITTPHICLPRNTNPSKEKQKQLPVLVPPTICLSSARRLRGGCPFRYDPAQELPRQRPHINRCYLESPCAKTANKSFVST